MNTTAKIHQAKMAKWAALIKEQSESTLTVKEWCDQNNVTIHAYHYWKHRLKELAVRSMMPDTSLHESRDSRDTISTSISVSLGDIRIEFGKNSTDEEIFRAIKSVRHA